MQFFFLLLLNTNNLPILSERLILIFLGQIINQLFKITIKLAENRAGELNRDREKWFFAV